MQVPSSRQLLSAWERGRCLSAAERGLALLMVACPDSPRDELAALSVGQRDRRLLELRELAFGLNVVGLTGCPECGERIELEFEISDLRLTDDGNPVAELATETHGHSVRLRLPNSRDLAAAERCEGIEEAKRSLLEACILEVERDREAIEFDRLPPAVVDAVVDELAAADPQADVRLALTCTACEHEWLESFDIASFLWTELNAWADRVLQEVHVLASAYGWSEREILALSPSRRSAYIEMVTG